MDIQWHEPDVSVIHLADGHIVEAEVNGRDLEGMHGYAFSQGREIEVERTCGTNEWEEVRP